MHEEPASIEPSYCSLKPAEWYYSGTDRSSEPLQQLSTALSVFLWPVFMKIHPTKSAIALTLVAVGGDLVFQRVANT